MGYGKIARFDPFVVNYILCWENLAVTFIANLQQYIFSKKKFRIEIFV